MMDDSEEIRDPKVQSTVKWCMEKKKYEEKLPDGTPGMEFLLACLNMPLMDLWRPGISICRQAF